ncbi:GNAT family N-acetyltransferase [Gammaproteobacteria bacterium]|jgi:predicted GNAT superfamily acetyltransferase|nr:GNAT family N-acetyltransferase [SAR86 cluster bacterium]MDA8526461.1 GNAT family N-acetyltransferase [Gammaproteobacteria bacterium]MDA9140503.1 GNAT family N-acetyltransferase [Gammaproteobacteria bacterium]MDA9936146.1 GNAT family N-acetyltransferase [Gammaproteobacteria bacterium]MDA9964919.1 GNAT family N-acetyltransferase [Gammaproteobacteria bacterium]
MNPQYRLHTFSNSSDNEAQLNEAQFQSIYDLNQANTPEVGSLESIQHLKQLIEFSSYNLLVLKEDEIVGYIICMREGSAYGSENYKFFTQRLKKFLYVDRVAIDEQHRRAGLGQAIYEDIFAQAISDSLPIALEVNTQPVNQPSLNFHEKMGFDRIGAKDFDDHSVAYFIK